MHHPGDLHQTLREVQKNDYNDAEAVAEVVQRRTVAGEAQPLDLPAKRGCPIGAQSNEVK